MRQINFIDLHSHILPGVDDGARTMDESIAILREAADAGVKELLLTPHVPYDATGSGEVSSAYEALKEASSGAGLGIKLHIGAELALSPDLPAAIKADSRLTINGKGKFALIELPSYEIPVYAAKVFFDLMIMGVTPIWAHPERCHEVYRDFSVVQKFVSSGVLLQINAGSLTGDYGRHAKNAAVELVKNAFGNFIASDTHSSGVIKTSLHGAFAYLEKKIGYANAVNMAFSAPLKVVS